MSKSPPDDPFGKTVLGAPLQAALGDPDQTVVGHPLAAALGAPCLTVVGQPLQAELEAPEPPNPFAKGKTVFGELSDEAFGSDPTLQDQTIMGAPLLEALAASEQFEKGFTQLGKIGVGHTEYGGAGATLPGGLPPPEAFAPKAPLVPLAAPIAARAAPAANPYPPAFSQPSHAGPGAAHGWEAAAGSVERELERARALHVEGVRAGKAGQLAHADAFLRESLDLRRRYRPPGDILIAHGCVSLATLYFYGQRPDLAEPLYREAWSLHRQGLGDVHPDTAARAVELARVLSLLGRAPEAYGFLRGAHEVFARTLGPMHPATLEVMEMMRLLYR